MITPSQWHVAYYIAMISIHYPSHAMKPIWSLDPSQATQRFYIWRNTPFILDVCALVQKGELSVSPSLFSSFQRRYPNLASHEKSLRKTCCSRYTWRNHHLDLGVVLEQKRLMMSIEPCHWWKCPAKPAITLLDQLWTSEAVSLLFLQNDQIVILQMIINLTKCTLCTSQKAFTNIDNSIATNVQISRNDRTVIAARSLLKLTQIIWQWSSIWMEWRTGQWCVQLAWKSD